MQFISARDLRNKGSQLWSDLAVEHEMIVTVNGRPAALLAAISENNFEQMLRTLRQARALTALSTLQQRSVSKGLDKLTQNEIEREIKAVRRSRKR